MRIKAIGFVALLVTSIGSAQTLAVETSDGVFGLLPCLLLVVLPTFATGYFIRTNTITRAPSRIIQ